MPPKRPNDQPADDTTGRQRKKQKMDTARAIPVQQPVASSSTAPVPLPPPKKTARIDSMKGLPGSIDVEKFAESRAFEIKAMQEAMKNARSGSTHRAWQELPRHLRRRAASHDVRRVPARLRQKARAEMDPIRRKILGRSLPKRGKARREPRNVTFMKRQIDKKWLETHLWHAKRMKMENMWGYRLALHPTEKSFRPSHRASVRGSILHDASYFGAVEVKGPELVLKTLLESCCDLQGQGPGAKRFLTGTRICETTMYKVNSYPFEYVGSVSIIWQASNPASSLINGKTQANTSAVADEKKGQRKRKSSKKGKQPETTPPTASEKAQIRAVWIRAHPIIFPEVLATIKLATSLTLENLRGAPEHGQKKYEVTVTDLRDGLNVFEIMGPKSSQVIRGALTPLLADISKRTEFKQFWASLSDLQSSGSVPRGMVVGFTVLDPRLNFPPKDAKSHVQKDDLPSISAPWVSMPTMALAQSKIWDEETRHEIEEPRYKKKEIDARKAQSTVPGTPLKLTPGDNRIPVMLIQRSIQTPTSSDRSPQQPPNDADPDIHGWTLIFPKGWSMPFLNSLIYTGTRVGGQRERAHQSFESGVPYFPRDVPATTAYEAYAVARAAADKEKWEKKPPAKRANWEKLKTRSPWKPDWRGALDLGWEEDATDAEGLVPTQREDSVQESLKSVKLWLLRGPDVRDILARASKLLNPAASLLDSMNALRAKRDMGNLGASTKADTLLRGALVQVRVVLCGRGCPDDFAIVYGMKDQEALEWKRAEETKKHAVGMMLGDEADETMLAAEPPSSEGIIGYVTSGNFSLSRGHGYAIGAVSVARYLDLQQQSEKLRLGGVLVRIRDRDGTIYRAAHIDILGA